MKKQSSENFDLEDALLLQGKEVEIGGNKPFLLDDPSKCWYVLAGKVDIFTVQERLGENWGRRSHYFSTNYGQMIFGMELPEDCSIGFLAVGIHGTRLIQLNTHEVLSPAESGQHADDFAEVVDRWLMNLSFGLSRDFSHRTDILFETESACKIEPNKNARAKAGILWIRSPESKFLFIGMEEISFGHSQTAIPISKHTWIQTYKETKVEILTTPDIIRSKALEEHLEYFYRVLLNCEQFNIRLNHVDDFNLFKQRHALDSRQKRNALTQLSNLFFKPSAATISEQDSSEDPLFEACRTIGATLDIKIVKPPEARDQFRTEDAMQAIAKASRVRFRKVILKGKWWTKDNGPLLGYYAQSNQPVALLPAAGNQYQLYDPIKKTSSLVTEEVAVSLTYFAYSFFRSFSYDQIPKTIDLFRFGLVGCKRDIFTVIALSLVGGLSSMAIPWASGLIYDYIIPSAAKGQLIQMGLALVVVAISSLLFTFVLNIALLRIENKMDTSLQAALWDRLLNLPVAFFRDYTAGDLAQRAFGINSIRSVLSASVISSVIALIMGSFNFGLLFYFSWRFALLATACVVLTALITSLSGYIKLGYQRKLQKIDGKLSGLVLQLLTGITKLHVSASESRAFTRWVGLFSEKKKIAFRARTIDDLVAVFDSAFPVITSMMLFYYLIHQMTAAPGEVGVGPEVMSPGRFLAFYAAFGIFLSAALQVTTSVISALNIVPTYERLKPILDAKPEISSLKSYPGELTGDIELSHVTFRYSNQGPLTLNDISFKIEPGEFVAFVGPSGSGKSTLLRLLLGFESPENGSIFYDGQDLDGLDIQAIRRQLGTVLQDGRIMSGDIFSNIVGSAPLTMADAWEVARMVGLEEDIKEMPMGMHTFVGEGATTLSGGQRQRLLIARALILKPRIVYFDEATSALDNTTQRIVSNSLEQLQATRVVIAHRLSTIVNADRILVMKAGRIVQQGNYDELMQQEGPFRTLARRQIA